MFGKRLLARLALSVAALAVLFLALSPLVFGFTSHVMLEVPTLALALMACFHFARYLEADRLRYLLLCCLATALTARVTDPGICP